MSGKSNDERKEMLREQEEQLRKRMATVKHKIAVISGKGGVGKSLTTVNLAMALARHGHEHSVGILDADIHGPCVPKMLGIRGKRIVTTAEGAQPVTGPLGIKVMSMDFLMETDESPVIWRGPLKMHAIRQFLSDINWGRLDYLLIDLPPGTGDEALSVLQLLPEMDGVIIVTIPSDVSQIVVKKAVTFARKLNVPVIGIVENMSGFVCPKCGAHVDVFGVGGGGKIAEDLDVPLLGKIPLDPRISEDSDEGVPFIVHHTDSPATRSFLEIVQKIEDWLATPRQNPSQTQMTRG